MYRSGDEVRVWDLDMNELGIGTIKRVDSKEIPDEVLKRHGFEYLTPYVTMGRITMPDDSVYWACEVWVSTLDDGRIPEPVRRALHPDSRKPRLPPPKKPKGTGGRGRYGKTKSSVKDLEARYATRYKK